MSTRARPLCRPDRLQRLVPHESGDAGVRSDQVIRNNKPAGAARYQFSARARSLSRLEHNDGKEPGAYFARYLDYPFMRVPITGLAEAFEDLLVIWVQPFRPSLAPCDPGGVVLLAG